MGWILVPFFVQIFVILFDEFYFHVRRGLPKWERLGHPLDTLTVLACFAFILFVPYSSFALKIYIGLAIFSCIFVTKDEFVHKECCPASEQWLHALLFLNHPVVLTVAGLIWPIAGGAGAPAWLSELAPYSHELKTFLMVQTATTALFFLYQFIYWNLYRAPSADTLQMSGGHLQRRAGEQSEPAQEMAKARFYAAKSFAIGSGINNLFYEDLGEAWYEEHGHPIALLRAENRARNPWICEQIQRRMGPSKEILDIGCGAGFLTNALALDRHRVTGIDQSLQSLGVARKRDVTKKVRYLHLDAFALPFPDHSFDVVCAMDFLEHVEMPSQIIRDAARLLRPNGLFFFHTFNRNLLSYLIVIKGVEWCVPNTPANMHVYSYFIKPVELKSWCEQSGLQVQEMHGLSPCIASIPFWKSLLTRKVDPHLEFSFTSSLKMGYLGVAKVKF